MLSERAIRDICIKSMASAKIPEICDAVVRSIQEGNPAKASIALQDAILLSVSQCIHDVLRQRDMYK